MSTIRTTISGTGRIRASGFPIASACASVLALASVLFAACMGVTGWGGTALAHDGASSQEDVVVDGITMVSGDAAPDPGQGGSAATAHVIMHFLGSEEEVEVSSRIADLENSVSFDAAKMLVDDHVSIEANRCPVLIELDGEAPCFAVYVDYANPARVIDITAQASYDGQNGTVTLPAAYADSDVTVAFYVPGTAQDIEVPLVVDVRLIQPDGSTSARSDTIPCHAGLPYVSLCLFDEAPEGVRISATQNGIEVPKDRIAYADGYLNVCASALGGPLEIDVSVTEDSKLAEHAVLAAPNEASATGISAMSAESPEVGEEFALHGALIMNCEPSTPIARFAGLESHMGRYGFAVSITDADDPAIVQVGSQGVGGWYHDVSYEWMADWSWVWGECLGDWGSNGTDDPSWGEGTTTGFARVESIDRATGTIGYYYEIDNPVRNTDGGRQQSIFGRFSAHKDFDGYIEVHKHSTDEDISAGNAGYSLAGASYGIYSDRECTVLEATLTTDETGFARSGPLALGSYWCREIAAPAGFSVDHASYGIELSEGSVSVDVYDAPLVSDTGLLLRKVDANGTVYRPDEFPDGWAPLENACYEMRFFDGVYHDTSQLPTTPSRTWTMETDEDGLIYLDASHLVSGDELYMRDGTAVLPLGTLAITEVEPPAGYARDEATYLYAIASNETGTAALFNAPTYAERFLPPHATLVKRDQDGAGVPGVAFTLSRQEDTGWTDLETSSTDAQGNVEFSSGIIDREGTYRIAETSWPDGFMAPNDSGQASKRVFAVTQDTYQDVYRFEFVDYRDVGLSVYKYDGDSLRESGLECPVCAGALSVDASANCLACASCGHREHIRVEKVAGATFTLYRLLAENGVEPPEDVACVTDNDGTWLVLGSLSTDAEGYLRFDEHLIDRFGIYRVTETLPAGTTEDGWMLPHDSWTSDSFTFTVDAAHYPSEVSSEMSRTFIDYRYRDIVAEKTDLDDGSGVPDTEFTLARWTNPDDEQARPVECGGTDTEGSWVPQSVEATDEDGSRIFHGLTFGYYRLSETLPNRSYAYWNEIEGSTPSDAFFTVGPLEQKQVQVYENKHIALETTIDKSTIAVTSAGFQSLAGQTVSNDNVGTEKYRYDIDFSSGATNVRADQYTVCDPLELNRQGIRLADVYTPIVVNDSDGLLNVWYRTNLSDETRCYSEASATTRNPVNALADGTDRLSTRGYRLMAADVDAASRHHFDIADLGLADDEYVTALMLEYGSVEPGFATTSPLTYLVTASHALANDAGEVVIDNSATSHITRNYETTVQSETGETVARDEPVGLWDDAEDRVSTRVIDTFSYEGSTRGNGNAAGAGLATTSDTGVPKGFWAVLAVGVSALLAALLIRRTRCS